MINTEAVKVCRLIKAFCPAQVFDEWTTDAWTRTLLPLDYADACQAVDEYFAAPLAADQARFMQPGHIAAAIRDIRGRRLAATPMPEPPAGLDPAEYSAWQHRTREAIAAGTYTPPARPKGLPSPGRIAEIIAAANPAAGPAQPDKPANQAGASAIDLDAERARQLAQLDELINQTKPEDDDE